MSDLIARLEAATEGSAALDLEIMKAVGWTFDEVNNPVPMWCAPGPVPYGMSRAVSAMTHEYPYTRSLDAALTLVPEGWSWRTGNLPSGKGFADLGTQASLQCIEGETLALALCIAALKARAKVSSEAAE